MIDLGIIIGIVGVISVLLSCLFFWLAKKKIKTAYRIIAESRTRWKTNKREIEQEKREILIKLKDELYKKRTDFETEIKRERAELDRLQSKINTKYELIEKKESDLDLIKRELQEKERVLSRAQDTLRASETKVKNTYNDLVNKLERASSVSREEARQLLLDTLQNEVHLCSQKWIQKVEEEARQVAKEKANQIIVTAMQRYVSDQVCAHSSAIVPLPNEEMKGRIIGKEGRNIKALEMATGMEFVIGEALESITISGFNPIRREIARRALTKLVADGRINPSRIEETVAQCEKEIEDTIQEYGKEVILEFNLQGVHPEIVTLLGKLHFRTSFSQNVLMHSKEVGLFCRMIAQELGLDGTIALRAGLFHDIGKAVTAEVEGPHAQIGADIARRCGEHPIIVNAIAAHHPHDDGSEPFESIYAIIVVIADAISACRPGARRETLAAYVKRLEQLEDIAHGIEGVKKAYALQAGREIRVIVEEDSLNDEQSAMMAREIARKIEAEMAFPGQIKVNVIREKRYIEYAR